MSATPTPIVRFYSIKTAVQSIATLGLFVSANYLFLRVYFPALGALVYLALVLCARRYFFGRHTRGLALVKKGKAKEAISIFEKAYEDSVRYAWVDRNRGWVVGSSSSISYQEMALCNLAFCYLEIGERRNAIETYRKTVKLFPDSALATRALKLAEVESSVT